MTGKGPVVTPGAGGRPGNDAGERQTEAEVLAYLKQHPDFLSDHPEVLESLAPASRFAETQVIDLQTVVLQRVQSENSRLRETRETIIAAARDNRSSQSRIHASVLQMLAAGSFEKLIHTVTADLPLVLHVDAVTICLEAGNVSIPRAYSAGLRSLPEGGVDRYIGPGRDVELVSDTPGERHLFGAAASLIRSQALARLDISPRAPRGLLALGAREHDTFHHGQGTELISFLSRTLEIIIRQWLRLPP